MAIDKVVDSTILDGYFDGIADAIRGKKGDESTYTPAQMPAGIRSINDETSDVNFFDYNGDLVYKYTSSVFAGLTELPANPTHEGLIAQGWNWTLSDAKSYVAKYGMLDIGQNYITDDGATRFYISIMGSRLETSASGPNAFQLKFRGTVTVNWGDGGSETKNQGGWNTYIFRHTYAAEGDYVISVVPEEGAQIDLSNGIANTQNDSSLLCQWIKKIEIGNNIITGLNFSYLKCLETISVPKMVNGLSVGFEYDRALRYITIPDVQATCLGSAFACCSTLKILSIPKTFAPQSTSYLFQSDYSLERLCLPEGLTSLGTQAIENCYMLSRLVVPDTMTAIASGAFKSTAIKVLTLPPAMTSVDVSQSNIEKIVIPASSEMTGLPDCRQCGLLQEVEIDDTSDMTTDNIPSYQFYCCYALTSIIIPASVTSIGSQAFQNCASMKEMHIKPTTPPTISRSNTLSGIPNDCIMYIPQGTLADYQNATNWAAHASKFVEEA